jgi:hypothetical protein
MKGIITDGKEDKKRIKWEAVLVLSLIGLLILSSIAFSIFNFGGEQSQQQSVKYKEFTFYQYQGFWQTNIRGSQVYFSYLPQDLEKELHATQLHQLVSYSGQPLYVVSQDLDAEREIYLGLSPFASRIQKACFGESVCEDASLPIKNCQDRIFVIRYNDSSEGIQQEGNCVLIKGPAHSIVRLTDESIYKILGILEQ